MGPRLARTLAASQAMGVTATDSNPRQLHGINDAPTKPTNLPRPKAYLPSSIGFCRQKTLPNSAAKLLAQSCITRLDYKVGLQAQQWATEPMCWRWI